MSDIFVDCAFNAAKTMQVTVTMQTPSSEIPSHQRDIAWRAAWDRTRQSRPWHNFCPSLKRQSTHHHLDLQAVEYSSYFGAGTARGPASMNKTPLWHDV